MILTKISNTFMLIFLYITSSYALNLKNCRVPLGMQSGNIPDKALSASSSFDTNTVGPQFSRIRTEVGGGAWCPAAQIHSGSYEYLEINLNNLTVITLVETQGRFGNGQGQEYVEQYMIEYKREDDKHWIKYRDRRGESIFNGNSNTYIAEIREISPPIIAKKIRFIPYSKVKKTVCLRVEIYGCNFNDGLVWYRAQQGDRRNDIDFIDNTYDGTIEDGLLKDGLGQLTDGEIGQDNYRSDTHYFGLRGYEWLGWRRNDTANIINSNLQQRKLSKISSYNPRDTLDVSHVQMLFKFDSIRNFSSISIHCNNMFTKDVQIFEKAIVQFSIDGTFTKAQANKYDEVAGAASNIDLSQMIFEIQPDKRNESARFIRLDLANRIAKYMRIKLYFASKWLLLSEINFESSVVSNNMNSDVDKKVNMNDIQALKEQGAANDFDYVIYDEWIPNKMLFEKKMNANSNKNSNESVAKTSAEQQSILTISSYQFYFILFSSSAFIFVSIISIVLVVIFIFRRQERKKRFKNVHEKLSFNSSVYADMPLKVNFSPKLDTQHDQSKFIGSPINQMTLKKHDIGLSSASSTSSSSANQTYHTYQANNLNDTSSDNDSREYADPTVPTNFAFNSNTFKNFNSSFKKPNANDKDLFETANQSLLNQASPYASVDIFDEAKIECESIQSIFGTSLLCLGADKSLLTNQACLNSNINKFLNVNFKNVISSGSFGKICKIATNDERSQLAAKVLVINSNDQNLINSAQKAFIDELSILSRVNHPNISNMVGYCENPHCVVFEYNALHLDEFIKNQTNSSFSFQLYLLAQISSAMKYLEQLNVVHRDLALRNCLVYHTNFCSEANPNFSDFKELNSSQQIQIKITDMALCLPQYRKDYFNYNNSKLLPIRYMPAEALFHGNFSSSSDVWSFGILMWQMFTNCVYVPFNEWSNTEYLNNLKAAFYANLSSNSQILRQQQQHQSTPSHVCSSFIQYDNETGAQESLLRNVLKTNTNTYLPPLPSTPPPSKSKFHPMSSQSPLKLTQQTSTKRFNDYNLNQHEQLTTKSSFIFNCFNMAMPLNCTKEIYDLMIECSSISTSQRPTFRDIDLFLQAKLFGAKCQTMVSI